MSKTPASITGGVKAFSLQGRLYRERERLHGMTSEERAWRAQFLKDQVLSKNEPIPNPLLRKELYNPIRRFYMKPGDILESKLVPVMGEMKAKLLRYTATKFLMGVGLFYAGVYYIKYNHNDWTRKGGWRIIRNRPSVLCGELGYPGLSKRSSPSDYASRGFQNSPI